MKIISAIAIFGLMVASIVLLLITLTEDNRDLPLSDSEYFKLVHECFSKGEKVPKYLQRPNDWFYRQRAYPGTSIDAGLPLKGIEEARILRKAGAESKAKSDYIWRLAGPTNIPGRITDIEVDPSNPSIVYAASASGGIFKTSDDAASWTPIFDDAGIASMGDIAIHPADPNIVYAGTGEANGAGSTYDGFGMYKSTDGGATWTHVGLPDSYRIGRVVIDTHRPDTIFVAVNGKLFGSNPERGVYRSTDGGDTWEQKKYVADSAGCIDLVYDPGTQTVIAAFWERIRDPARRKIGGIYSGVYRSTDAGDTWIDLSTSGLPSHSLDIGRIGLTLDTVTGVVYAQYANSNGDFSGMYRSQNLGLIWSPYPISYDDDLYGSWSGGWYFGQVRVVPGHPDSIYSLGLDLFKTTYPFGPDILTDIVTNGMHVDQHALYISPDNPSVIWAGNDGGVYKSTDGAQSWDGPFLMGNTQFYAITFDPTQPLSNYGGTQDNGTNRTLDSDPDTWDHILGGDGFYVLVDPTDPNRIYAEYQNGYLLYSTNMGYSWYYGMNGIPYDDLRHEWSTPVVMDPNDNYTLYYGANLLYKSTSRAQSWTAISGDLTNGPHPGNLGLGTITTIDVAPSNSDVIYVGTDDANVWVTTNGGSDWTQIDGDLPDRWITRVTVDPLDEAVAYVSLSGYKIGSNEAHIYRTTDFGTTWTDIQGNLPQTPVNDVIVDPDNNLALYAGTDVGVFITGDLGETWRPLGLEMPIVPVLDLDFHQGSRTLLAGTHGRSAYTLWVTCEYTPEVCPIICGDANGDGNVNVGDAVFMVNLVFHEGPLPFPEAAGDANCDGNLNVGDAVYLVNFVFQEEAPEPCADCP